MLGGSWVVISIVTSRITMVITYIRAIRAYYPTYSYP